MWAVLSNQKSRMHLGRPFSHTLLELELYALVFAFQVPPCSWMNTYIWFCALTVPDD